MPGLDNHAMGTIFEELVRRFNEENNEEAGEHWTPRDAVKLMANLIFLPIADQIESGTYLVYDGACGTGGMLTVAEETLQQLAERARQAGRHPSLRPGDQRRDLRHLQGRPAPQGRRRGSGQHRRRPGVLDAFQRCLPVARVRLHALQSALRQELEERPRTHGRQGRHQGPALRHRSTLATPSTRSSPAPATARCCSWPTCSRKMKHGTTLGSRIAEVHNGSSLFTGDAGQGESNIRRWIIENDWLEAIVALPLNMFYNTGIATYIWVLTNRKPEHRRGKVQLIDATAWFKPLRKNLGKKNCELSEDDIKPHLRHVPGLRGDRAVEDLPERGLRLLEGDRRASAARSRASTRTASYTPKEIKAVKESSGRMDEAAPPVITENPQSGAPSRPAARPASRRRIDGKPCVVEYEPDTDLRDTEQVPLLEEGGIEAFIRREVLPVRCRRLVRRPRRQDRLRDQLHPLLLQAAAAAHA